MSISFEPLGRDRTDRALRDAAGLIYDTDPYIYPAMFASREDALRVLPEMIRGGDRMFRPENLFVAASGEAVTGIVLWHRGSLRWDEAVYRACGGDSPWIGEVRDRYFSSYASVPPGTVSLLNVCTSVRGRGMGGRMLDAFLRAVPGPYELYVLADNAAAIRLYERKGFTVTERLQGFSVPARDLPCLKMEKGVV